MASNNKCSFCNGMGGAPIAHFVWSSGARFQVCHACVPDLEAFAILAKDAAGQHGRGSGATLSHADRLRQRPRKRGMSPTELAESLRRTAEINRQMALRQIAPKTVELSTGPIYNRETGTVQQGKRRTEPRGLKLSESARRYVQPATAGAVGSGGPARRPA
jgi:hypothetical protein